MNKFLFALAFLFFTPQAMAADEPLNNHLAQVKNDPAKLYTFLQGFPKGGELHIHLLGSNYAERLISFVDDPNLCINHDGYSIYYDQNCPSRSQLQYAEQTPSLYNKIIDAWSMRNFTPLTETGHDHFFNAFDKFFLVSEYYPVQSLIEVMRRAAKQNELYLELLLTTDANKIIELVNIANIYPEDTLAEQTLKLRSSGLLKVVKNINQKVYDIEQQARESLRCHTAQAEPACKLVLRYQYTGLRTLESPEVFSLLLAGFELVNLDKQFVGVNLVQPEDDPVALRDYHQHMAQITFLKTLFPQVAISLHAGELTAELVPQHHLKNHIQTALQAGAQRIGHGVSIREEHKSFNVLAHMRKNNIPVEINLTSNDAILNIKESASQFPVYLTNDVPIVLSTDDEGILRTTLTKEYTRAVLEHNTTYSQLKRISRNSLEYSFLSGRSLWQNYRRLIPISVCAQHSALESQPNKACLLFLKNNDKAQLQWNLEQDFIEFEKKFD